MKYELQNILSGESGSSHDAIIQAVAHHLRTSQRTSPMAEEKHQNKGKETEKLIDFAAKNKLFRSDIEEEKYISEGAEQKVYIKDSQYVFKINDAIYYASWEDYFHNLLLHNYFFADTAYQLMGFYLKEEKLYAVVKQPFVKADALTNLSDIKVFLNNNGFENTKNYDYHHPQLGVILEDLHDENVLTYKGLLYFIDTVFYIDSNVFWA
ncbi:MAG: hypothetical protein HC913_05015 [Microscillaceae bacterium]|nr:hypothetical protein [Microscillaceae bacterium]